MTRIRSLLALVALGCAVLLMLPQPTPAHGFATFASFRSFGGFRTFTPFVGVSSYGSFATPLVASTGCYAPTVTVQAAPALAYVTPAPPLTYAAPAPVQVERAAPQIQAAPLQVQAAPVYVPVPLQVFAFTPSYSTGFRSTAYASGVNGSLFVPTQAFRRNNVVVVNTVGGGLGRRLGRGVGGREVVRTRQVVRRR